MWGAEGYPEPRRRVFCPWGYREFGCKEQGLFRGLTMEGDSGDRADPEDLLEVT